MKMYILTALAVSAILGTSALAQTAGTRTAKRLTADTMFIAKAAEGGMAEVELGRLAQQRGSNEAVKTFGKRMETDHTKINDDLKTIAESKNVTWPTALNARDQATMDRLSNLSGAEFDRAYMADMVRDHRADVAEFRRQADHATDPDVKNFAAKYLPTLQDHLRMAEDTQKQLK